MDSMQHKIANAAGSCKFMHSKGPEKVCHVILDLEINVLLLTMHGILNHILITLNWPYIKNTRHVHNLCYPSILTNFYKHNRKYTPGP